jgi:hypothetical protein
VTAVSSQPFPVGTEGVPMLAGAPLAGLEALYTVAEVAGYLRLDASTTRRLFADRRDVVKLGRRAERAGKRCYCTLRIPASAVKRFLEEHR